MAAKFDENKRQWHLLPIEALEALIEVLEHGAVKYGERNWRTPPYFTRERLTDALRRHQAAIDKGQLVDPDSGLLHAAHAACMALFQLQYEIQGWFGATEPEAEPSPTTDQVLTQRWENVPPKLDQQQHVAYAPLRKPEKNSSGTWSLMYPPSD